MGPGENYDPIPLILRWGMCPADTNTVAHKLEIEKMNDVSKLLHKWLIEIILMV